MKRLARTLATLAVAGILPASAIGLAQQPAPKAEAPKAVPPEGVTTTITVKSEIALPVGKAKVVLSGKAKDEARKDEVRKEAVKPDVRVFGRVAAQNLEPQIQRFVVQLRPMTRAEIHLVLTACSPSPEQKAAIMAEEETILKDVAKAIAQAQMGIRRADTPQPDPRRLIPEAMSKFVNERLSPEQAARYRAESDAKAEFSRKVALANIVANIDEELMLSPDQRTRLTQAIDSNWKPAWYGSNQAYLNGNQMVPNIPDAVIVPILEPIQKRAWDKKQKTQTTYWGNFLMMGNFAIEEPADPPAVGPGKPGANP